MALKLLVKVYTEKRLRGRPRDGRGQKRERKRGMRKKGTRKGLKTKGDN